MRVPEKNAEQKGNTWLQRSGFELATNLSTLFTVLAFANHGFASKSEHSAPIVVGKTEASKDVIFASPDLPLTRLSQNSSFEPSAETTPTPVTTIFLGASPISVPRARGRVVAGTTVEYQSLSGTNVKAASEIDNELNIANKILSQVEASPSQISPYCNRHRLG